LQVTYVTFRTDYTLTKTTEAYKRGRKRGYFQTKTMHDKLGNRSTQTPLTPKIRRDTVVVVRLTRPSTSLIYGLRASISAPGACPLRTHFLKKLFRSQTLHHRRKNGVVTALHSGSGTTRGQGRAHIRCR